MSHKSLPTTVSIEVGTSFSRVRIYHSPLRPLLRRFTTEGTASSVRCGFSRETGRNMINPDAASLVPTPITRRRWQNGQAAALKARPVLTTHTTSAFLRLMFIGRARSWSFLPFQGQSKNVSVMARTHESRSLTNAPFRCNLCSRELVTIPVADLSFLEPHLYSVKWTLTHIKEPVINL